MKKLIFGVLIVLLAGCEKSALLTVNSLAKFGDYSLTSDVRYGPHKANKLDIYQPNRAAEATIIFFYGGCWGACETLPKEQYRFVAQTLAEKDYIVVIPDFRVYPEVLFGEIMEDAVAVVDWAVKNAGYYGAKDDDVILMGHSSGAHMAAMLTTNADYLDTDLYDKVDGFIGLAGPYHFEFDKPYQYKLFAELIYDETQPSFFVDGSEPPMLLLYGKEDKKVHIRNINAMRSALEENSGQYQAILYDDIDHADIVAALSIPLRGRYAVTEDIVNFVSNKNKAEVDSEKLEELLLSE